VNPDPRFLCRTTQIEEPLTELMYGIETRKGFITLTGEVGAGKTTRINSLLDWLHRRGARVAFLFNPQRNSHHLLDFILPELVAVPAGNILNLNTRRCQSSPTEKFIVSSSARRVIEREMIKLSGLTVGLYIEQRTDECLSDSQHSGKEDDRICGTAGTSFRKLGK